MRNKYLIPFSQPNLTKTDFKEIKKCFNSSWISSKSPWVEKFEKLFAEKISQTKYAVAVNSGTSALFLALKALNIGVGDEVIIPSLTMIATINAITWVGAKPILVDSQSKNDWNISIATIEKKISQKTKAIIPVHIYGYPCLIDKILTIAKKYRLAVIEDAAEAMGSTYRGKNAGSFGDVSCFSLYANKIITTGNGGVVATNNFHLYKRMKKLSFFDFNEKNHFKHYLIGFNFVLSGLQAALGVSQIKRFSQLLKKRRQIFFWYREFLKENPHLYFIQPNPDQNPNYWFPAIIFKRVKDKKTVIEKLTEKGVETRDFFLPIHRQPVYKDNFQEERYPIAEFFFKHGLLLPAYHRLRKEDVVWICQLINRTTL